MSISIHRTPSLITLPDCVRSRQQRYTVPKTVASLLHQRRDRDPPLSSRARPRRGERRTADRYVFNTGISTYVWILSNKKEARRAGKVQLINAADLWKKMKKSLGSKRKQLGADDIDHIVKLHGAFEEGERVRILDTDDFGYTTVTVNRPLRDERGNPVSDKKEKPIAGPKLKDTENIPLASLTNSRCQIHRNRKSGNRIFVFG